MAQGNFLASSSACLSIFICVDCCKLTVFSASCLLVENFYKLIWVKFHYLLFYNANVWTCWDSLCTFMFEMIYSSCIYSPVITAKSQYFFFFSFAIMEVGGRLWLLQFYASFCLAKPKTSSSVSFTTLYNPFPIVFFYFPLDFFFSFRICVFWRVLFIVHFILMCL